MAVTFFYDHNGNLIPIPQYAVQGTTSMYPYYGTSVSTAWAPQPAARKPAPKIVVPESSRKHKPLSYSPKPSYGWLVGTGSQGSPRPQPVDAVGPHPGYRPKFTKVDG
jgi:hypothetical protein